MEKIRGNHFKSFDDTRIFFQRTGRGKSIVTCNGLGTSFFFWRYLTDYFGEKFTVINWDYRGHYHSAMPANEENLTIDAIVYDLKELLDKTRSKKVLLVGHSMGVQVLLEFCSKWSDRVAGLVLMFGSFGSPMNTFFNTSIVAKLFPYIYFIQKKNKTYREFLRYLFLRIPYKLELASLIGLVNGSMCKKVDFEIYFNYLREMNLDAFFRLALSMQKHNFEKNLSSIKVPTLIISGEDDIFTPPKLSKRMHEIIPDSELLSLPKASHAGLLEQPEAINLRIEKFIIERKIF